MLTIGVMLSYLPSHYHTTLVSALHTRARELGAALLVLRTSDESGHYDRELAIERADVWIVVLSAASPTLLARIHESGRAVCVIGHDPGLPQVGLVRIDNRAGVLAALEHLYTAGHRAFAYLGMRGLADVEEREAAFLEFCAGHPDCPPPVLGTTQDYAYSAGVEACEQLLAGNRHFTALVCATDANAQGAIIALRSAGKRVPEDVAVTGFDNAVFTRSRFESISTVDQNLDALAHAALEDVLARRQTPGLAATRRRCPVRFIARATSGQPDSSDGDEKVSRDTARAFRIIADEVSSSASGSRGAYLQHYISRLHPRLRFAFSASMIDSQRIDQCLQLPEAVSIPAQAARQFPLVPDSLAPLGPGDILVVLYGDHEPYPTHVIAIALTARAFVDALSTEMFTHELESFCNQLAVLRQRERLTAALDSLHQTQDQLVRAEKAAALGMAIAGISHELGTPLGNCRLASSTLADMGTTIRKAFECGTLKRSDIANLLDIVASASELIDRNLGIAANLVASFKRLRAEPLAEDRRTFALDALLTELSALLAPQCAAQAVKFHLGPLASFRVCGYPQLLVQCLTELVENALEHGFPDRRAGNIWIDMHDSAERIVISVSNDGDSLAPEHLRRVFDPFFTSGLGKRSGLGLAMLNNLVSGPMGGEVHAENRPDGGMRFSVALPHTPPTPA